MKILFKLMMLASAFFGLFFLLSKVDWKGMINVEDKNSDLEHDLGENIWEIIKSTEKEINEPEVLVLLDSMMTKICDRNGFEQDELKLELIDKKEVNAFALPDNRIIVYSGLILQSENVNQVAGVLSHELAHIRQKHVMKKLIKETGLAALMTVVGSGGGAKAAEVMKLLSSSAYDRKLEQEADYKACDYMAKAGIHPEHLANFLYLIASEDSELMEKLEWVSTHPEGKKRSENIMNYIKGRKIEEETLVSDSLWSKARAVLVSN
jgi:predicted Zn-dependent protease